MKNRKIGIVAMILTVALFVSFAYAATYEDAKYLSYTGYYFAEGAGSTQMTSVGYSNALTTGAGAFSSTQKYVIESTIYVHSPYTNTVSFDSQYKVVGPGTGVTASSGHSVVSEDQIVHTCIRYNSTNEDTFRTSTKLDYLELTVLID